MTLTLNLSPQTEERLQRRAVLAGMPIQNYVADILESAVVDTEDAIPQTQDSPSFLEGTIAFGAVGEAASSDEEKHLLAEYRRLIGEKRHQGLRAEQEDQLRAIETRLDDIDSGSLEARHMYEQIDLVRATLGQLVTTVSALPNIQQ